MESMLNGSAESLERFEGICGGRADAVEEHVDRVTELAATILKDILQFRRVASSDRPCAAPACRACLAPHLPKVVSAIRQGKPIPLVLPAFPGKSPNPAKVLGVLPDMAERCALQFLGYLGARVRRLYKPGLRIILCSDGRVFSDLIGMEEGNVTAYQRGIERMVAELGLTNFESFTLDELAADRDFPQVRAELMERHGRPLESLRERVRRGGNGSEEATDTEAHRMYCGITRFLVEDATHPGQTKSRTAVQKDCRARAYQVILRSNAWSELIAERFPEAVRLSIHPQGCGSAKLGIRLFGTDSWMTPWHGVAVETGGKFVPMKRWEAEQLGAELVRDAQGRASHYRLAQTV